ncbi:gliding motility-associated C-terminal domain-containing protein [Filimonas lacunae]|uniref:Gliding motility-associated C-terminal domain-containing protein n=1 Tax=Filimonas lacunae TaxID=477680 RepID=A0A173M923_9BACT|nr:PKD domain-containing protein [Filimonas lacunae]BAV04036.1 Muc19 precursor [Filimonas lacunae]SIT16206.1 gliding motility-associated C-terminal domain-containing protein [Filimonas lacunae]
MKMWLQYITGVCLCVVAVKATGQGLSNKGKEFWVGYGLHQFMEMGQSNGQEMVLYLSAEDSANVTVTIRGRTATLVKVYRVSPNTVIVSDKIPKDGGSYDCRLYDLDPTFGGNGGDGLFHVSIHIESDVPIVAYAHIYGQVSSGATMLMPVETWGYTYTALNSTQVYKDNCFSFAYIVAQHDNTVVSITPTVPTRDGHAANVAFERTLNKGDIYQVVAAHLTGDYGYELTGTTVRSIANSEGKCYPVAFFSGSSRTYNPCSRGSDGGDNDMQQCFPYEAWGRRYFTAPTSTSVTASAFMINMYKVVVRDAATIVKRNGKQLTNYDAASKSYSFESTTADYIEADKPVLLAQYMSGGPCLVSGKGDPEMIYLSPIEQGIKRIGFYRNNQESIEVNYLTLIIPKKGVSSLTIDGVNSYTYSYPHPQNPDYTVVIKRWPSARAQCIVQSDSAFTAITYGLGFAESYGYNAGTRINNLNAVIAVHNVADTAVQHSFTCKKTPVELAVLMANKPTRLEWLLSKVSGMSPATDVAQDNPVPVGTVIINNVTYYKYALPGVYTFANAGTVDIPVLRTDPLIDNCIFTEEIIVSVEVREPPYTPLLIAHSGCVADPVTFKGADTTYNGFQLKRWKWTFADGATADTIVTAKTFATAGAHQVQLQVVSTEGCVADTTASFVIYQRPEISLAVDKNTICEHGTVQATATAQASTIVIKNWYWNFGNDTVLVIAEPGPITFDKAGTYTIKVAGKASDACVTDTATQVIMVQASPVIAIRYPEGCLPADGVVTFVNNTTVSDGQSLAQHEWNFGDAGATAANPNTSVLAAPSHVYTTYGSYNVYYKATTAGGCVADSVIVATFNVKPVFFFPVLPAVCENAPGTVSVAMASVTNGVEGTGYYKGAGIDASGRLSPSLAGAGVHTVQYIFTTKLGCVDSVASSIEIYPGPVASFYITDRVCANAATTITDASAIASGSITAWNWAMGDGAQQAFTNGNAFDKIYATAGEYTVLLQVQSDKGCADDTSLKVHIQPLPVAAFALPGAVCMPEGQAQFTNQSAVADQSALTYAWYFGDDGSSATVANPAHIYTAAGDYAVGLKVTSAYGCSDSTGKQFAAFYNKPVAAFTVSEQAFCQGRSVRFTSISTAENSTVSKWSWLFGDNTSSSLANAVKKYNDTGHYVVQLKVTSAAGCVSDVVSQTLTVYRQPVIDAGPSFEVNEGTTVTFSPVVNDSVRVSFQWQPAALLNNATLLRPSYLVTDDVSFVLTATGMEGGCTAEDSLTVKVLRPVIIPNVFTPNGDGINDVWDIKNLASYPHCTVSIFNRYGQLLYATTGYGTPWNGLVKGERLPVGTYYYVIDLKNGSGKKTGSLTIL